MNYEIILIRHGQTEFNLEYRIQGSLDSDLTESGKRQARLLGGYLGRMLEGQAVHAIFSSPQPRALATTRLILAEAGHPDMKDFSTDERIQEIRCGEAEGKTREELDPNLLYKLRIDPEQSYPKGESMNDLMRRAKPFLEDLELTLNRKGENDKPKRAIVISHGHFNRAFAAVLSGLDGHFALRVLQENTGFSIFQGRSPIGDYRMVSWNETPHLRFDRGPDSF